MYSMEVFTMFKYILVLAFSFLGISVAHAETLFYKKSGQSITPQEHEILYKIMLETQFPMCIEYEKYEDNEMCVINEKIKRSFPTSDIEACFLPTTLYHLFCLNFIRENVENIKEITQGIIEKNDMRLSILLKGQMPHEWKDVNLKKEVINFHNIINTYIFKVFLKNNCVIPHNSSDYLNLIDKIDFWQPLFAGDLGLYDTQQKPILSKIGTETNMLDPCDMKRAIAIECHAYNTYQYVLYRGSNVINYLPMLEIFPNNRCISFGSLLGGILFDAGGCAYAFLTRKRLRDFGWALLIDKKEYAEGILKNMFVIPTLIGLLDLIGHGEYFHARTKVLDIKNVSSDSFAIPYSLIANSNMCREFLIPYYQIKADTKEKAEEIYNQIFEYIKNNHIIFAQPRLKYIVGGQLQSKL